MSPWRTLGLERPRVKTTQDVNLPLNGPDLVDGTELSVSIIMRRLGQYKTAWPAVKTTLLQADSTASTNPIGQVQPRFRLLQKFARKRGTGGGYEPSHLKFSKTNSD